MADEKALNYPDSWSLLKSVSIAKGISNLNSDPTPSLLAIEIQTSNLSHKSLTIRCHARVIP